MAKDFWVDQSDPPFPQIQHRGHPNFEPEFCELMSLTEARRTVKETCRQHRNHWLAVMNHQVSRSANDIVKDALAAGKIE